MDSGPYKNWFQVRSNIKYNNKKRKTDLKSNKLHTIVHSVTNDHTQQKQIVKTHKRSQKQRFNSQCKIRLHNIPIKPH